MGEGGHGTTERLPSEAPRTSHAVEWIPVQKAGSNEGIISD